MKIRNIIHWPVTAILMFSAYGANATYIQSIDIEVRESTYTVGPFDTVTNLLDEFYTGDLLCSEPLEIVQNVGSLQPPCSTGINQNIATLITVGIGYDSGDTFWQFGPDWGRGGVVFFGGGSDVEADDDLWWAFNWNNTDELVDFTTTGSGYLGFLGFEGCCAGGMSLRYTTDRGQTWTMAAVNIPEPATLGLLGLGLLGLGVSRRRVSD